MAYLFFLLFSFPILHNFNHLFPEEYQNQPLASKHKNIKIITKDQIKTSMEKLRSTQQFVTPVLLKMPSINEIHFPKMKTRLNFQENKFFKNQKSGNPKYSEKSSQANDKLIRSYSMSLMTIKKDLKKIYSPKKKRLNLNPENIICIRGQKGQNFGPVSKSPESMRVTLFPGDKQKESKFTKELINLQANLTQGSCDNLMRKSMYPGVKLESTQYAQKRTQFLKKFLPGLENINEASMTARLPKKKHLFNAKFLVNKKHIDQLPDELVTRKLVWDGKEMKKIDHNLIYRDIVEKSKNQKNQKLQEENIHNRQDKIIEIMRLSAWEFHDDQKQHRDPEIKTPRN